MTEKILDSTRAVAKRSSSYLASIDGNDSLELVWKNGQIHVQGGSSSSVTQNTPSWDWYSINPSRGEKAIDEGDCIANSASLTPHQAATTGNSYSYTSSSQCLPSAPLKKLRMDSSQSPATTSQKLSNSNVFRPSLFLKSTNQRNSTKLLTHNTKPAGTAPEVSIVIDSSKRSSHEFQGSKTLNSDASNRVSFVPRYQETPPPDQQSEAVGQYSNQTSSSARLKIKGKANTNYCDEPFLESSSACSLGASNNTNDSTYLSDNDEEPEDVVKEKFAREGIRIKRKRNIEIHSLYERNRRDKINKKLRTLKELIPNCNKMDKVSMLDDAIEYLKTLKLQLQIMSRFAGFRMPLMMFPNATHHMINTSHLSQLMGAGMGFRPGTGIPCNLPQFPIAPLPGFTGVQMFGFPNRAPPMPVSHAPFIPMVGNPTPQPLLATSMENQASAQLTTLMASVPKNSS